MSGTIKHCQTEGITSAMMDHDSVEALFQQGLNLHRQNDPDGAIVYYQRVLELDPRHAEALHFLGIVALTQRRYVDALERFEKSFAISDVNAVCFNNYGVALKSVECFHEAHRRSSKPLRLTRDTPMPGRIWLTRSFSCDGLKRKSNRHCGKPSPSHRIIRTRCRTSRNFNSRKNVIATALKRWRKLSRPDRMTPYCYVASQSVTRRQRCTSRRPIIFRVQLCFIRSSRTYIINWLCNSASLATFHRAKCGFKRQPRCRAVIEYGVGNIWAIARSISTTQCRPMNIGINCTLISTKRLRKTAFMTGEHCPVRGLCRRFTCHITIAAVARSRKSSRNSSPNRFLSTGRNRRFVQENAIKSASAFSLRRGTKAVFYVTRRVFSNGLIRSGLKRFCYHRATAGHYRRFGGHRHIKHVTFDGNFERSVQIVRDTACDILYYWKVGADTWNFFLPMCRLASVQFTSWSTHGTSGMEHIDHYLSQAPAEIEYAQEHYTERLFRLCEAPTFQPCYRIETNFFSRDKLGLPKQGAIYFCPHRLSKYHPDYDFYLKDILENDPVGHIVLLTGDVPAVAEKFKRRMRRNLGDTLMKRMIFIPKQPPHLYHHIAAAATMILDSHVYSGGVTSYDAFCRGVPCVTQVGELLVQRYPYSSYHAMGIADAPVATQREEYVRMAVRLGTDADYRHALSQAILEKGRFIFERVEAVREFERFFETVMVTR